MRRLHIVAVGLLLPSCVGPNDPTVTYPIRTTLRPASANCHDDDPNANPAQQGIAPGRKRFELRLPRTTSAIWVRVEGQGVYYKPAQHVDPSCFSLDVFPGDYEITVHAENSEEAAFLQTGLTILEYGHMAGPSWYRSVHFACGVGASNCTQDELRAWLAFQRQLPRGVLDACGSSMARNVRVDGSRSPNQRNAYRDLTLSFRLKVYDFAPYQPPGSPDCKPPVPNR